MNPGLPNVTTILVAWIVGTLLFLAGVGAYALIERVFPRILDHLFGAADAFGPPDQPFQTFDWATAELQFLEDTDLSDRADGDLLA